jgi:hypothetical protein
MLFTPSLGEQSSLSITRKVIEEQRSAEEAHYVLRVQAEQEAAELGDSLPA